MAYPSTQPHAVPLPPIAPGEHLVAAAAGRGILAGRFVVARAALPAGAEAHRLLALLATWNCGSWHGTAFPFAQVALMADDAIEQQGRLLGHFQIDVRACFALPPIAGTLHVSCRLLHLWSPPLVVATA